MNTILSILAPGSDAFFAALGCLGPAVAGATAIVGFIALRTQRVVGARKHSELLSMLDGQRKESAQQIAEIARGVEDLERSQRSIEEAGGSGIPRSRRSQALQLLRSGMSPESAASSLGLGTREMRLIANVSRVLTLQ